MRGWILGARYWVLGSGYSILDAWFLVLGTRFWRIVSGFLDLVLRMVKLFINFTLQEREMDTTPLNTKQLWT